MSTLSVCTYASSAKKLELPFKEVILSALPITDELIIINCDDYRHDNLSEVDDIINDLKLNCEQFKSFNSGTTPVTGNFKMFHIPFPKRLRKNCYVMQRTNALMQASCDYILLLDGDEVLHENSYERIKLAMELGHDAYTFKVKHFWRDYNHFIWGEWWYSQRPYLFRNNLGIFDGYRSWLENGKIKTEYTSDLTTWDYKPVMDFAKRTSVELFHYGYLRSDECMLNKYNEMETWFHNDNKSQKKEWDWNMSAYGTTDLVERFEGIHPKVMKERIEEHKARYMRYYVD